MFGEHSAQRLAASVPVLAALLFGAASRVARQAQSPFLGSVPAGQATRTTLDLSRKDAFARALRYNLGAIESRENTRAARAVRLRELSALLPNLSARFAESVEQISLRAQGFRLSVPGVNIPTVVGPFNVEHARGYLSQEILNWSDGTFSFALTLAAPIFRGTRVRADKLAADSALARRRAELADQRGRIDQQVRTAFFNLKSSSDLVSVARSNIDLANQTLAQAQDRFRAGVADNLEVVQAQESAATANESYIASLYSFNLAKLSSSLATGVAEQSGLRYLGVR